MINDHFEETEAYDAAQGLSDLFNICLQNDDVQDFGTRWDQILSGTTEMPPENVLERLYKKKLQVSEQLRTVLTQPQSGLEQRLLTGKAQRNIRACLYHSHTHVCRMSCEPRATGPAGPRKDSALIILEKCAMLLVWSPGPAYARCASVVTTGPNMTYSLPSGERATAPQPAVVSPSVEWVPPSVNTAHPLKSSPFFCVVVRLFGRFRYLPFADGKRNLWKGMSAERPVRQRAWYAWAYDGVIAVRRRILPSMQSSNFPGLSEKCRW